MVSPNGKRIIGTLETLTGVAKIQDVKRKAGRIEYTYSGETNIDWDGQKTVTRGDMRVFVDVDGDEWTENQIVLADE